MSPLCGDGNTLISQVVLEQNNCITGGLVTLLSGLPGFRIVLLLDKGFKVQRFNPQNVTLPQFCQTIPKLLFPLMWVMFILMEIFFQVEFRMP